MLVRDWGDGRSHTIRPAQQCRDKLQCFKFLWITSVQAEEMQEVIRDDLLVDIVFGSSFFEYAQGFGKMFVQSNGFVSEFAD
jgi:hypothetical protein